MFDEACVWSHANLLRCLELIWYRSQDIKGRDYYLNTVTNKTQWSKPYHTKTFVCNEIEVDAFVYIMLTYDIIPKSQFVELMHVMPKDLWPNSDVFLKQLAANASKKNKNKLKINTTRAMSSGNSVNSDNTYPSNNGLENKIGADLFAGVVIPDIDVKSDFLGDKEFINAVGSSGHGNNDDKSIVSAITNVSRPGTESNLTARSQSGSGALSKSQTPKGPNMMNRNFSPSNDTAIEDGVNSNPLDLPSQGMYM